MENTGYFCLKNAPYQMGWLIFQFELYQKKIKQSLREKEKSVASQTIATRKAFIQHLLVLNTVFYMNYSSQPCGRGMLESPVC